MLTINELFASIQGEGNEAGKPTIFIRFTGCDFKCHFCDSKHTWLKSNKDIKLSAEDLFERVKELKIKHVTLTGGNPALYKEPMKEFVKILKENGYEISIETQGSIYRDWFKYIDNIVISPKNIPNRPLNEEEYKETIQKIIDNHKKTLIIKIPVFNDDDIKWIKNFVKFDGDYKLFLSVGNEYLNDDDISKFRDKILTKYEWLINKVLEDEELHKCIVLPQIHTLIWANKQEV